MKTKTVLSFMFLIASIFQNAYGQFLEYGYGTKEFTSLLNSKLVVVRVADPEFDNAMKKAITEYWKVTDFEFADKTDLATDSVLKDTKKTFLIPQITTYESRLSFENINPTATRFMLFLYRGGHGNYKMNNYGKSIMFSPFSIYSDEKSYNQVAYRLDYIVKSMNDIIQWVKNNKIKGTKTLPTKYIQKTYQSTYLAKTKTLVLNEETRYLYSGPVANENEFKESYKYSYEFVSDQRYREIMMGNSEEYLCLFLVSTGKKFLYIYEPATRNTVFLSWGGFIGMSSVTKTDIIQIMDKAEGK